MRTTLCSATKQIANTAEFTMKPQSMYVYVCVCIVKAKNIKTKNIQTHTYAEIMKFQNTDDEDIAATLSLFFYLCDSSKCVFLKSSVVDLLHVMTCSESTLTFFHSYASIQQYFSRILPGHCDKHLFTQFTDPNAR